MKWEGEAATGAQMSRRRFSEDTTCSSSSAPMNANRMAMSSATTAGWAHKAQVSEWQKKPLFFPSSLLLYPGTNNFFGFKLLRGGQQQRSLYKNGSWSGPSLCSVSGQQDLQRAHTETKVKEHREIVKHYFNINNSKSFSWDFLTKSSFELEEKWKIKWKPLLKMAVHIVLINMKSLRIFFSFLAFRQCWLDGEISSTSSEATAVRTQVRSHQCLPRVWS